MTFSVIHLALFNSFYTSGNGSGTEITLFIEISPGSPWVGAQYFPADMLMNGDQGKTCSSNNVDSFYPEWTNDILIMFGKAVVLFECSKLFTCCNPYNNKQCYPQIAVGREDWAVCIRPPSSFVSHCYGQWALPSWLQFKGKWFTSLPRSCPWLVSSLWSAIFNLVKYRHWTFLKIIFFYEVTFGAAMLEQQ